MLNIEKFGKKFMKRAFEYYGTDEKTRKTIEMVRQDQEVDDCIELRELAGIEECPKRKLSWKQNDCHECARLVCNWLFSEYEPPLLENGDGLKAGDDIMVSLNKDYWVKNKFAYYYDGKFYCSLTDSGLFLPAYIQRYLYARLPEEGE